MVADTLAADPFDGSVAVAVTVRVNGASPGRLSGTVMVNPSSSSGASAQVPPPVSVPADRVAPAGTPAIVIESTSEPSRSLRAAAMSSAIGVFSLPAAVGVTVTLGVSTTAGPTTDTTSVSPSGPRVAGRTTVCPLYSTT